MASPGESGSRTSALGVLKTAWARVFVALSAWSVLVGLGLLPSAAAAIAAVVAFLSKDPLPVLIAALAVAIASNVTLALVALTLRSRMNYVRRIALQALETGPVGPTQPDPWLPVSGDLGSLGLAQAQFEDAYARASATARVEIGPDVEIAFRFATLLPKVILFFDGTSIVADRSFVVAVDSNTAGVQQISRGSGALPEQRTPWRVDETYVRLIGDSWLKERPFKGGVKLSPMRPYHVPDGDEVDNWSGWRVTYTEEHDGVVSPDRDYGLRASSLTEIPIVRLDLASL